MKWVAQRNGCCPRKAFSEESLPTPRTDARLERRCSSVKVIHVLDRCDGMERIPEHIRSDNGPELLAGDMPRWQVTTIR
jgi:hypothetical protein